MGPLNYMTIVYICRANPRESKKTTMGWFMQRDWRGHPPIDSTRETGVHCSEHGYLPRGNVFDRSGNWPACLTTPVLPAAETWRCSWRSFGGESGSRETNNKRLLNLKSQEFSLETKKKPKKRRAATLHELTRRSHIVPGVEGHGGD